jgi:hypothetical protein
LFRAVALLIIAGVALAACGGGDKTTPTTTGGSTAQPNVSGASTPTGAAAASSPVASGGATPGSSATTTSQSAQPTATAAGTQPQSTAPAATQASSQGQGQAQPTASNPQGASGSAPGSWTGDVNASSFAYGFNVFWRGDDASEEYNHRTIQTTRSAGFNWIRIQIQWKDLEPAKNQWNPLPLDRLVQQNQGSNVKILASVAKPPDWAVDPTGKQLLKDYADWEGFTHFLAERYKGKIQAWEIWNEQNLASEMGGTVRLEDYCHLLEGGYNGIKMADKDAIVVFGGLTPTGVNDVKVAFDDVQYLQRFYNFQGGYYTKFFDVLGMHVSSTNNPPDKMYPNDPCTGNWSNHPSYYFRRAEQLHQVMIENRDQRPAWITEFGWTTKNEAKGYEYGALNNEQDQASYLVGAFDYAKQNWPWVTGMFVWNLNFSTVAPPSDEKYPWSVLNGDWSPRPSYTALKNMAKS